jgi:hypothetical protein
VCDGAPRSAQTETVVGGNEMPVEAREQVGAPRPFRRIGLRGAASPAQTPTRPETRGRRSQERRLERSLAERKLHRCACSKQRSGVGRMAVVEHEVVAVRVRKEGHVADAGVEGVTCELDALGLELGAGGGDIVAP